jgi:hypothetical protein
MFKKSGSSVSYMAESLRVSMFKPQSIIQAMGVG